jgi:hypothetical protein
MQNTLIENNDNTNTSNNSNIKINDLPFPELISQLRETLIQST